MPEQNPADEERDTEAELEQRSAEAADAGLKDALLHGLSHGKPTAEDVSGPDSLAHILARKNGSSLA